MCEGGVAIWIRSAAVRPSASRQCVTAAPNDAWVCRTAFGSPVVPELNTRTASAPGSGGGNAPVPAAMGSPRSTIRISSASTGWSPMACPGLVMARACSTSARFQAGLSSTTAAPRAQVARTATTNSGRFEHIRATRPPARTPCRDSRSASPTASASSWSRRNSCSSKTSATNCSITGPSPRRR
jgi:hypothetical protein